VTDVIAMVESGQFGNADIYITPPDSLDTDEDSADEYQGGLIDNLRGHQLQAEAEIVIRNNRYYRRHIDGDDGNHEDSSEQEPPTKSRHATATAKTAEEDPPPSRSRVAATSRYRRDVDCDGSEDEDTNDPDPPAKSRCTAPTTASMKVARKWCKDDLPSSTRDRLEASSQVSHPIKEDFIATLWFEQFFSDDVIQLIVNESISYAKFRGNHHFTVYSDEIRGFSAVLIKSGYVPLPRRRMYWEQAADCHSAVAACFMTRDRFEEVMRNLHFADNNNLNKEDKFATVRPLFDILNKSFLARF